MAGTQELERFSTGNRRLLNRHRRGISSGLDFTHNNVLRYLHLRLASLSEARHIM